MQTLLSTAVWMVHLTLTFAQNVSVETDIGTIVGEVQSQMFNGTAYNFKQFLGIPYAEAPTGERRFNRAQKKANFSEPFIAQTLPPFCPQSPAYLDFFGITLDPEWQSEDCLRLNIFTPEQDAPNNAKRPVMVWIHGGFYEVETQNWYLAKLIAAMNDVIYVTLNYRLSVLGFLSTGDNTLPGNHGMWDQHMAIQWVHDHIENFGGDPEKITIAGESAGSAAVVHHALYKGSKPLFNGVIAQSGSANNAFMIEMNPHRKFLMIVEKTGCSKNETSESIACLQNKSLAELMNKLTLDLSFPPVVDGEFIEIHPDDVFLNQTDKARSILSDFGKYNFMFGLNSDEGALMFYKLEELVAKQGQETLTGYTQDAFMNKIIPFALEESHITDTPTLRSSIANQYLDWTEPSNHELIKFASLDLLSDTLFNAGVMKAAMMHASSASAGETYLYVFDHRSRLSIPGILGSNHAEEVIFALGFPSDQLVYFYGLNIEDPADNFTQADIKLSVDMMEYWSNFVKSG